jgi:hypothetical protein
MREIVSPLSGIRSPFGQRLREIVYVLFVPSGSTRMLTSTGDVFKVREA